MTVIAQKPAPTPHAASLFDSAAKEAGINIPAAKKSLAEFDQKFGGQHGRIPEQVLRSVVSEHFGGGKLERFAMAVMRTWEDELDATLPPERQAERKLTAEEWAKHREEAAKKAVKA